MAWKQVKAFDINKMGKRSGYCLANVRQGYGIAPKFADAKADMEANKAAGTLHDISTLPQDVAVPVYIDVSSPYEHIMVADHGTFYSDGKKLTSLGSLKVFGWGETVNGVRVVEQVADPVKKSNEEIAEEVMDGKWGNDPERAEKLTAAGYDRDAIQAIVDAKKGAGSSPVVTAGLQVGDKVVPIRWVDVNGRALRKTRDFYFVKQIVGNRVTLAADSKDGTVYAAMSKSNLKEV